MPIRPFDNVLVTQPANPVSASFKMSSYAAPLAHPAVVEMRPAGADAASPEQAVVDIRLLAKGVSWAFALEGAAAFALYIGWHLLALLR